MLFFQPVLYTILQLVVLAGLGFALKRYGKWPDSFFRRLSKFLVTYALPLYLFAGIARTDPAQLASAALFPVYAAVILAIGFGLAVPVFTLFRFRGTDKRAGVALASFGNSAYLPLTVIAIFQITDPKLAARMGDGDPSLYIGAMLLVISPLLWSAGNLMLTRSGRKVRILELITPPFVGVAAGFIVVITNFGSVLLNTQLPLFPVFRALEMLGNVTFPMILVSLGAMIADLQFGATIRGQMVTMAALVAAVRFVVLPGLFVGAYFLFLRGTSLSSMQLWVLFLEVSVPPATNFSVMAGSAGVNENNTAFTLLATYVIYVLVLPLELMLFLGLPGIVPA